MKNWADINNKLFLARDEAVKKLWKDIEGLEKDLQTIHRMRNLYKSLNNSRGGLDEALHEAEAAIRKSLTDRQGADSLLNEIELTISTQWVEGIRKGTNSEWQPLDMTLLTISTQLFKENKSEQRNDQFNGECCVNGHILDSHTS